MKGIGRILVILLVLCCVTDTAAAQFWHRLDSVLTVRQMRVTTDTAYVRRPNQKWIAKVRYNGFGNNVFINSRSSEGEMIKLDMRSALRTSIALSGSYKGLGLTLSFAPRRLFHKTSDQEYDISYYSNWWGADVSITNISNFDAEMDVEGQRSQINLENTRFIGMSVNTYYVFNGRKFSYPAAFNNTWIQKRSAGSIIAAATFYSGQLSNDMKKTIPDLLDQQSISMKHIAIGGGYAYNYVTRYHWLLHMSAQPTFMIWKNYTLEIEKDPETGEAVRRRLPMQNAQLYALGRVGAIYSRGHYYIGIQNVIQTFKVGNDDEFSIQDVLWKGCIYYGVRF